MEFEEALFQWVASSGLGALLGAPDETRFYELKAPQGVHFPAGVYQRGGAGRQVRSCTVDGAVAITLQVDWYAVDKVAAKACAKAFRQALDPAIGFPLYMGGLDSPAVFVKVKAASCDNEFDGDDPEPGLFRRTQLWTFWIFETT